MANKTYSEKLRDPRWQKKRLEILSRDEWTCQGCGDDKSTLHVHHRWYETGNEPWDYSNAALVTLCEECHETEEINKEKQKKFIQTFLAAGFLNKQMDFLSHIMSFCFESISGEMFELYMTRLAISESFREDVHVAYRKECERIKQTQQSESTEELPF